MCSQNAANVICPGTPPPPQKLLNMIMSPHRQNQNSTPVAATVSTLPYCKCFHKLSPRKEDKVHDNWKVSVEHLLTSFDRS